MKLKGAQLSEINTIKGQQNAFKLTSKSGSKKMYLAGETAEEAQKWHQIISNIAEDRYVANIA